MGAKRAFDLITSSIGLVILSPVFLVIAGAIRYDTPGPVFYRGLRTGLNGIPFRIIKFRTMVPYAASLGGWVTSRDDSRVTRVGKVLRKYKLDELPQLINVIKGDMSVVGPRPEVSEYTGNYGEETRFGQDDRRRHLRHFGGEKLQGHMSIVHRLKELGRRCQKSPAQLALRWALDNPAVSGVIAGIKSRDQLEHNVESQGWRLNPGNYRYLVPG